MSTIRFSWHTVEAPGLGHLDFCARVERSGDDVDVAIDDALIAGARRDGRDVAVDPHELAIWGQGGWEPLADWLREVALDADKAPR